MSVSRFKGPAELFFPNVPFRVMRTKKQYGQTGSPFLKRVVFKVPPYMTKPEIKQYLTKIYGMQVTKVNTINVEHYRQPIAGRKVKWFKKSDFKKAIVTFVHQPEEPTTAATEAK